MSLKRVMNYRLWLSAIISLQMAVMPLVASAQEAESATTKIGLKEVYKFENVGLSGKALLEAHEMAENLATLQYSKLSADVVSPLGMANHVLRIFSQGAVTQEFVLDGEGEAPPPLAVEHMKFEIHQGKLYLVGYNRGKKIADQLIPNIHPVAVTAEEADLAIVLDRDGKVRAFEMSMVKKLAFKGAKNGFPFFTIFDSAERFAPNENSRIEFISRGLMPFVKSEVAGIENPDVIIPRDRQGNALIETGHVVIYDEVSGRREVKAVLHRQVIEKQMQRGAELITWLFASLSRTGMTPDFDERTQRALDIDGLGEGKSPVQELVEILEKDGVVEEADRWLQENLEQLKMDPLLTRLVSQIDRQQLRILIEGIKKLKKNGKREFDKMTGPQWANTFEKTFAEATKKLEQLKQKAAGIKHPAVREEVEMEIANLESQVERRHLDKDLRPLTKAAVDNAYLQQLEKRKNKWLTKENAIRVTKIASIIAGVAGYRYGMQIGPEILSGEMKVPYEIFTAFSWVYNTIPPLFRNVEYIDLSLGGIAAMLAVRPLLPLLSFLALDSRFPLSLQSVGYLQKKLALIPGLSFLKDSGERLQNFAKEWKDMTLSQRLGTAGLRFFAKLLPIVDQLSWLTRQNFARAMKNGVNPLRSGKVDGEKARAGFNLPWASEEYRKRQDAVIDQVVDQRKKAEMVAWLISTAVVSEAKNIDPVTIQEIQAGGFKVEDIERVVNQPSHLRRLSTTANHLTLHFERLVSRGQLDLSNISPEQFVEFFEKANTVAETIVTRESSVIGRGLNTMQRVWQGARLFGRNSLIAMGNLGVSDANYLKGLVLNTFLTGRLSQAYAVNHPMSVVTPYLFGKMADPSRPDLLAAQADGFLGVNGMQMYNVFMQTYLYWVRGAARRALLYQLPKVTMEGRYTPIADYLLTADSHQQSMGKELKSWLRAIDPRQSNLGSYLSRDLIKQTSTIHAQTSVTTVLRTMLGQPPIEAALGSLSSYFGQKWTFGWLLNVLTLGSDGVQKAAATNKSEVERLSREIYKAQGDTELLEQKYKELLALYQNSGEYGFGTILKAAKEAEASHKKPWWKAVVANDTFLTSDVRQKILSAFGQQDSERMMLLMSEFIQAYEQTDLERVARVKAEIEELLLQKSEQPEFQKALGSIEERAQNLAELALRAAPKYTEHHLGMEKLFTWVVGSFTPTVLSTFLLVATFSDVTVLSTASIIAGSLLLHGVAQVLLSRRTWLKTEAIIKSGKERLRSIVSPKKTLPPMEPVEPEAALRCMKAVSGL